MAGTERASGVVVPMRAGPRERVMHYGAGNRLVGIYTRDVDAFDARKPCVVILNSGIVQKAGPNNLNTSLARHIARQGHGVFRFDFAGVGDSPNRTDGLSLKDGVLVDVRESLDHLEAITGATRFVLIGLCSGADNGLRAAREERHRVVGLTMIDTNVFRTRKWYLVHYARRLTARRFWKDLVSLRHPRMRRLPGRAGAEGAAEEVPVAKERPELYRIGLKVKGEIESCLRDLLESRVSLCFAFTGGWEERYNYRDQLYDVYPDLELKRRARLLYYPEATHTFTRPEHRRQLEGDIAAWLDEAVANRGGESAACAAAQAEATQVGASLESR